MEVVRAPHGEGTVEPTQGLISDFSAELKVSYVRERVECSGRVSEGCLTLRT